MSVFDIVNEAEVDDRLWLKQGIDPDHLEASIFYHKLNEDPEFKKLEEDCV